MMIPIERVGVFEGVEGVESACEIADIEITAKVGHALEPLPEGATYLGFIFSRGESSEEVERSLRSAHATLRFQIAPSLQVVR
jgi:hypothetical protein